MTISNRERAWSPERKLEQAALMHRLFADDAFRTAMGFLHADEREQILVACRTGRPYIDIAGEWLISEKYISQLARAAGIYREGPHASMPCARRYAYTRMG